MLITPENTLKSQLDFAMADPKRWKFPAILGGFGSGKTASIPLRWLSLIYWRANTQNKRCKMMIIEPTKEMVRDVLLPVLDEFFDRHGIEHSYHKTYFNYTIKIKRNGLVFRYTAWLRSSDTPEALTGKTVTDIIIDEFDKKHPIEHQQKVWNECISRIRKADYGTCAIVTTPEGYKYTYELYKEPYMGIAKKGFYLIKAKTYENKFLPSDYVESLYSQYSAELVKQYIEGEFVNVTQGKVYYAYDRDINNTSRGYRDDLPIILSVDFNVNPMHWVIIQNENGKDYVIDELFERNTTTRYMAEKIAAKYGKNKLYLIYGDYYGNSNDTRSLTTDYDIISSILPNNIKSVKPNPAVVDRINAVNGRLKNSKGEHHLFVNSANCPMLTLDFEQVVWDEKKREIDKKSNSDRTHGTDALGYYIEYKYSLKGSQRTYVGNKMVGGRSDRL